MFWDLIKIGVEDVQKAFEIDANLYDLYVEKEIKSNADLLGLMEKRDSGNFDWKIETPHGGAGTTLNACVLYCLIRHYDIRKALETGVSGGYYTSFMLAAIEENDSQRVVQEMISTGVWSLDIANDSEVGKLIPAFLRKLWNPILGKSSLETFKEWKIKKRDHSFGLYSHDSLHKLSHMLRELHEFKQSTSDQFIVFIDDEKADFFWQRCIAYKLFDKPGFDVKYISGKESRFNGQHLGGFLRYKKCET